tara:strand:- start:522 stop:797 length:276 start_codon:yes stop_codon:yes gene_type:complete
MKDNLPKPKKKEINSDEKQIIQFKSKISKMSYEECLKELDKILHELQNDSILIDNLYKDYIRGNILLDHCQKLLTRLEQDVVEINLESFID